MAPRRAIALSIALAIALLAAAAACARPDDDSAATSRDSGARAPSTAAAAPDTTPRAAAADTLTGLGAPPATAAPAAGADTGDVVPTATELAELHAEMAMPLAGIRAADLPDTFLESRGDHVHHALDIPAPRGTPVLSATPGRVLKLFTSQAGGLMVYAADSSERFILMYAHLDAYAPGLRDGQPLARGQTIGVVGTTGNAPPNLPHLHFAIARPGNVARWWTGTPVDPRPLLQAEYP